MSARPWSDRSEVSGAPALPRRRRGGTASGRHVFILVSVVLMSEVKPSTLPCPAHLGTDSIHFVKRQLALEAMPTAGCWRRDEVHHVASTHWVAAPRGQVTDWTARALPGVARTARDEYHVGNGWSQFSSVICLLLPLLTPRLKVKPSKIITGLWDVSNYVLHPPDFTEKGNGIQKEQRNRPKSRNRLAANRSCPAICFLTYLTERLGWIT